MKWFEDIDIHDLFDNEMDNEITFIADNLEEFIKIIIKNENPFE